MSKRHHSKREGPAGRTTLTTVESVVQGDLSVAGIRLHLLVTVDQTTGQQVTDWLFWTKRLGVEVRETAETLGDTVAYVCIGSPSNLRKLIAGGSVSRKNHLRYIVRWEYCLDVPVPRGSNGSSTQEQARGAKQRQMAEQRHRAKVSVGELVERPPCHVPNVQTCKASKAVSRLAGQQGMQMADTAIALDRYFANRR